MKMMKQVTVGLASGFLIAFTAGGIEARQLKVDSSFSGSFVNTDIDVNEDGQKAGLGMLNAKGFLGADGTIQGVLEYVFAGETTCPNGNVGFAFTMVTKDAADNDVVWRVVRRVASTGDLLIGQYTTASLCFDPLTTIQFFTVETEIIGGTGRFEDASGTARCEGTAITLVGDGAATFFGEQSGTCRTTINLPTGQTSCSQAILGLTCP